MALTSPVPLAHFLWPARPTALAEGTLALVWLAAPAAGRGPWRQHGEARQVLADLLPALPPRYGAAGLEETARGPAVHCRPGSPPVGLSLSYSPGWTLVGLFPGGRLGVDVSRVEPFPDWADTAALYLGPAALARLSALPADEQAAAFHREWVRMEAAAKALGSGLAEWSPASPAALGFEVAAPGPGHVAAAAVLPAA